MSSTASLDPDVQSLLFEAAEWRALEVLFQCPSPEWKRQLVELRPEISAQDITKAMDAAIEEASEGTFHSILGPGGPAPAREASYREIIQLGYLISELTT